MKKIFTYACVAMVALCSLTFTACGSSDDDEPAEKAFTINGDWVAVVQLLNTGETIFQYDHFEGSAFHEVLYRVSGTRVLDNNQLVPSRITDIKKEVCDGSFKYDGLQLICTYPTGEVSGFVSVYSYECFVWSINLNNIEMIRPNTLTDGYKSQLEQLYQSKFAK